jgi:crossover junction endodeoxyribonuclease RuvC
MIILGIDPGTVRIGYGVIKKEDGGLKHLESGLITLPPADQKTRFLGIEKGVNDIVEKFKPHKVGVEKLFFAKNKKTALRVAEARGVIINTLNKKNIPILEVGPGEVKLAVTGDGRASKEAVAKMVNLFLKIEPTGVVDDVSDALAIAIAVSNR